MKKNLFSFCFFILTSGTVDAITFNGICSNFIPTDLMNEIPHVEKDGFCYISMNSDLTVLMYDRRRSEKFNVLMGGENLGDQRIPLFIGSSVAILVSDDELYVMEEGNENDRNGEQWFSRGKALSDALFGTHLQGNSPPPGDFNSLGKSDTSKSGGDSSGGSEGSSGGGSNSGNSDSPGASEGSSGGESNSGSNGNSGNDSK